MKLAWIGLGGNLGNVRAALRDALNELADETCSIVAVSGLYETPPWGVTDQPRFLNACATIETSLSPAALLAKLHEVEAALDRVREVRWGPRTVDLDLLAYEDFTSTRENLVVPHPRVAERAFVLVPLAEIAPDLLIGGRTVAERAAEIDRGDMERVSRAPW